MAVIDDPHRFKNARQVSAYGKQKTRKKKAAVALARKIAVVAWAMLRDKSNWDPKVMERIAILGQKKSETKPSEDNANAKSPIAAKKPASKKKNVSVGSSSNAAGRPSVRRPSNSRTRTLV